jgi:CrcB protein
MKNIFIVFAGGGAGSVLRYLLGLAQTSLLVSCTGTTFPWATLACNIGASLLLGWLANAHVTGLPSGFWLLLAVGLCGGWSTFSSFSMDAVMLLKNGRAGVAIAYITASFLLSLGAFWVGFGTLKNLDSPIRWHTDLKE